jgi:hypothetical protein
VRVALVSVRHRDHALRKVRALRGRAHARVADLPGAAPPVGARGGRSEAAHKGSGVRRKREGGGGVRCSRCTRPRRSPGRRGRRSALGRGTWRPPRRANPRCGRRGRAGFESRPRRCAAPGPTLRVIRATRLRRGAPAFGESGRDLRAAQVAALGAERDEAGAEPRAKRRDERGIGVAAAAQCVAEHLRAPSG